MNEYIVGSTYYTLCFLDVNFEYPEIFTLVYIGKNIDRIDDEDQWFFQDTTSYIEEGAYTGGGKERPNFEPPIDLEPKSKIYVYSKNQLEIINSIEELIKSLTFWNKSPEDYLNQHR